MLRVGRTVIVISLWLSATFGSYCIAMELSPRHGGIVEAISAIVVAIVLIVAVLVNRTGETTEFKKIVIFSLCALSGWLILLAIYLQWGIITSLAFLVLISVSLFVKNKKEPAR